MPIVKVIEVISSSATCIDDAIQNAVTEASKKIRNIDSVYVKDIKAHVKDGKITTYGVCVKFHSAWIKSCLFLLQSKIPYRRDPKQFIFD